MSAHTDDFDLILQESLEQIQSGQATLEEILKQHPDLVDELRPLLETALWFRLRKATVDPRPGFVMASQRRLVEQIKQEQAAAAEPVYVGGIAAIMQFFEGLTARRLAFQLAAVLLLVVGMVAGGVGVGRLAGSALPGDPFYRTKIVMENASLALEGDQAARSELHMQYAQRRLDEIRGLAAENRLDDIAEAVLAYEEHVNQAIRYMLAVKEIDQGHANELAMSLHTMLARNTSLLQSLAVISPAEVGEQIERVLLVSAGIVELLGNSVANIPLPPIFTATPTSIPTSLPVSTLPAINPTAVPVATRTPIPTPSPTRATSPTTQPTVALSATPTDRVFLPPLPSATATVRRKPDRQPTATPMVTDTQAPIPTSTALPSWTPTASLSPSATPSATTPATDTPTASPTSKPSSTPTNTATTVPSPTSIPTDTPTATQITPEPIETPTPLPPPPDSLP